MAVSRIKTSSILQGFPKSRSLLAGNAGFDPAATFLIERQTLNTTTTTVTFSSIPSTYKHLQIRFLARSSRDGVSDNLNIQFNGDSGSNYATHNLNGNGATAGAGGAANVTSMDASNAVRASGSSNTLVYGAGIINIHDYASTTINKTIRIISGFDFNGSGRIALSSGFRNSTSAVTSITLQSDGSTFAVSSTFALYGMKG